MRAAVPVFFVLLFLLFLYWLLPGTVVGQDSRVTTSIGAGNSFGGIGVMAEVRPFARGPLSLMASVGWTKEFFDVQPVSGPGVDQSVSSVAAAIGLRAHVGQGPHQGLLELSVLPVDDDVVSISDSQERLQLLYGLGFQVGYRASISRNLSLSGLGGVGYALNKNVIASRWKPIFGFGLDYAW